MSFLKALNFAWNVSDALPAVILTFITLIFIRSLVYCRGTARMTCGDGPREHIST